MDIGEAARLIEANSDFRLLRRVPAAADWVLPEVLGETRRGVFVDTETTGLDLESDEVIELALLPFEYERETGRIVSVDHAGALSMFRQPLKPIPAGSTLIHGISDAMVAGRVIDEALVRAIVEPAHIILAHNAGFDRPMVEKHWPVFEDKHWACSLDEIDWRAEGFGSAKLDYLLWARGWFHEGHRALIDAEAALFLLTLPLPVSGRVALEALLANARRPLWLVRAEATAFEQRASLKARGYRWDDGGGKRVKAWWIMSNDPKSELEWLRSDIFGDERDVPVLKVPATKRYSSRVWAA
ncbi:MAG: 3'-5' exonuclease [Hyphomonadaceae bacterium JAD_PAG50586_4]|nr:MAG: 3'-5' exonuclease [Hyphomonadaceae bacterium JAD_PAG50586_4]